MGRLLTIPQVAERLGISRSGVFMLMRTVELPSVLVTPRTRRVDESDLEAFLEARREVARPTPYGTTAL